MRTRNGKAAFMNNPVSHMQEAEWLINIPRYAFGQNGSKEYDPAYSEEMLLARAQIAMAHLKLAEMLVEATGNYIAPEEE